MMSQALRKTELTKQDFKSNNSSADEPMSTFESIKMARDVLSQESDALNRLAQSIPADFSSAAQLLASSTGSVIVIGIGKAGWIAQKISASLASTGTRSHYVHPSEAMHGDLGRIGSDDIVLALSNSGETAEMLQILPTLKALGVPIVSITSTMACTLGQHSDLVLDYGKVPEACPLGLAPTTTTTLMLGLGDALAMVVSSIRKLQPHDFARCHPGGSLGKKLSTVEELMRPVSECRVAKDSETVRNIYIQLSGPKRRTGAVLLTDHRNKLSGIFTDSDLARLLETQKDNLLDKPVAEVMTPNPAFVSEGSKSLVAVEILASLNISELPVVDTKGRPVGLIDITDVVGMIPIDSKNVG